MGLPWALGTAGAGAAQGQCWALGAPSEPGEGLWGTLEGARAGGDQSFSWVRGRDAHCAWGAHGGALLPKASPFPISAAVPASVRIPQLRYSCHRGATSGLQHLAPLGP